MTDVATWRDSPTAPEERWQPCGTCDSWMQCPTDYCIGFCLQEREFTRAKDGCWVYG